VVSGRHGRAGRLHLRVSCRSSCGALHRWVDAQGGCHGAASRWSVVEAEPDDVNPAHPLDTAVGGELFQQVQAVWMAGGGRQVAVPVAALIFDFAPHVAAREVLDADDERAAGSPTVAVADGVCREFAEQVDGVVGDGAVSEDLPKCGTDVPDLVGGAGIGLFPQSAGIGKRTLIHAGFLWSVAMRMYGACRSPAALARLGRAGLSQAHVRSAVQDFIAIRAIYMICFISFHSFRAMGYLHSGCP
jgi:hypothetical protein